jgi:hypothetical protein
VRRQLSVVGKFIGWMKFCDPGWWFVFIYVLLGAGLRNPLMVLRARNSSITIATFPGERS